VAKKVYETMFIFGANAYARNPGSASNGIKEIVESVEGELLASRVWNEQKLAYPINGQRKGVYWLSYIRMDGENLAKFNRACKLNDMIIRHLVIHVDPRLVDTLVAAASPQADAESKKGGNAAESPEENETETKAAANAGGEDQKETPKPTASESI